MTIFNLDNPDLLQGGHARVESFVGGWVGDAVAGDFTCTPTPVLRLRERESVIIFHLNYSDISQGGNIRPGLTLNPSCSTPAERGRWRICDQLPPGLH